MRYLIAFLVSLMLLAALPLYAADDTNCVTVEKFVSQNAETAPVEWRRVVAPDRFPILLGIFNVPPDVNVTEIRLFIAHVKARSPEAGIAFGHDGLICLYARVPPQLIPLVEEIVGSEPSQNL